MIFTATAFLGGSQGIKFSLNGLVGYYDISSYDSSTGIWRDRSGNGNDANVNGSTLTNIPTKGLLFNATDNWVTFPTFSGSTGATFVFWGDAQYNYPASQIRNSFFNKRIGANNGFNSEFIQRVNGGLSAMAYTAQTGTTQINQGILGTKSGSIQFMGFKSDSTTTSKLYFGIANADSSSWSGSSSLGWTSVASASGSIIFPYAQPLIFGSGSFNYGSFGVPAANPTPTPYRGTVGIIAVYNRELTNEEMESNYLAVSSSAVY